jgi:hypothetical protein
MLDYDTPRHRGRRETASNGRSVGRRPRVNDRNPHRAAVFLLILFGAPSNTPAAAQGAPAPPGPYVVDVRGVSTGLPQGVGVLPGLAADTAVPSRGNGFDVGGHIYFGRVGGARLGFGANLVRVRGTAVSPRTTPATTSGVAGPPSVRLTLRTIAPQLSLNFGTADGWSYVSAGAGVTEVRARFVDLVEASGDSGSLLTINAGAGARWFVKRRLAVGFDARLYRLSKSEVLPASMLFSISGGISLR